MHGRAQPLNGLRAVSLMWFLGIMLNGLLFVTLDPFHSEEACQLGARQAQIEGYRCIEVPDPEEPSR